MERGITMPKDHERNTSSMLEARQKIIQEKYDTLKTVLEDMIHNDEKITVPRVCKLSGLSKSYLYHNEKAKKLFNETKTIAEERDKYKTILSTPKNLDINPHMHHKDMLLQYEEMKRKLYETYMISFQLIKAENNRLRKAIEKDKKKLEYLQSSPSIKLHINPTCRNRGFLSYKMITPRGHRIDNGIWEDTIKGLRWGTYILVAEHFSFELANPIEGVTIKNDGKWTENKNANAYLLTITDKIKEDITIDILMNAID